MELEEVDDWKPNLEQGTLLEKVLVNFSSIILM